MSTAGNTVMTKEAAARFNLPCDERNKIVLKGPQFKMDANYEFTNEPVMLYKDPTKPNTVIGQLNYRKTLISMTEAYIRLATNLYLQ